MVIAYKLKNNEINKDFNKRGVQGIVLKKNYWAVFPKNNDRLEELVDIFVEKKIFSSLEEVREENKLLKEIPVDKYKVEIKRKPIENVKKNKKKSKIIDENISNIVVDDDLDSIK